MSAAETVMANSSSELSNGNNIANSSLLVDTSLVKARTTESSTFNLLTVRNHNGQYVIQQPLKAVNNGPTLVNTGAALPKSQIIVRQKPVATYQQTSVSADLLADKATPQRTGIKRPLAASDNIISKMIITKNSASGQTQAFPVRSPVQAYTLTSNCGVELKNSIQQQAQPQMLTKTVMLTPQGTLSPVKTVITTIPGPDASKLSSSPVKSPSKLTMIPVSGALNNQSLNTNFTVFSCALNAIAQAGSLPLRPGTTSKVIIKQGAAPTGSSSLALKSQTLPTLAPQTVQQILAPRVVHSLRPPQATHNLQSVTLANTRSLQQIQVPGSRFHYVRLVSPSSNSETTTTAARPSDVTQIVQAPSNVMPLAIVPAPSTSQIQITLPFQQHNATLAPKPAAIPVSVSTQEGVHHIIIPATSSSSSAHGSAMTTLVPIQPAPVASVQNQLPVGTSIATNDYIQGLKSFALVPASYVTQLQQQLNKSQIVAAAPPVPRQARDYVPIASIDPEVTQYTVSRNAPEHTGLTLEATGSRPRKPCNCTKSQCLKLYCDCFANGEFCQNCNCTSCANNLEHEEERSKAIKSCLDRNPQAFHPKIGKSREVEGSRQHNKGCNCKRSGCLKNYCECYEAKIMCSHFCKCVGCKNFEESPDRKTLMHLADAVEVRVQQQTAAKTKLSSQISCVPSRPPTSTASGERLPFALITTDVAEATSACLLAQAEEAERMKMPPVVQERMIIEEFGRCLMQIIESANRTRTASSFA